MRFMVIKDIPLDDISFLKGKYKVVSTPTDPEIIYEVDENYREKLKVLEEAGFIKVIKQDLHEIEKVEDLIPMTERVEIVQGGSLFLRVQLAGHILSFTEGQLLSPTTLRKYLLRMGKVLGIKQKDWEELLQYWLDIGEKVSEVSEEEEVAEKFLNYVTECRVVEDAKEAVLPYTLLLRDGGIFCSTDTIAEKMGISKRKLRSILSDYIVGNSVRLRVYGRRYRFWELSADKCGIDIEKQLAKDTVEEKEVEEEVEVVEEVEEDEEIGAETDQYNWAPWDGEDDDAS